MSLETLADSVVFLLLTTKKFQHPAHSTLSIYFCPWIGQRNQQKSCHSFSRRCPSVARRIWCKGLMLKDQTMSVVLDGSPLKAMQSSHTHSPQTALRWVVTSTVRGEEAARLTDGVHVPSEVSLLHVKLKESGLRTVEETFRSNSNPQHGPALNDWLSLFLGKYRNINRVQSAALRCSTARSRRSN